MRGFGVTSASFATELQMDKIARTLGMDPYEIRLLNAYRNGDMRPYQKVVSDASLVEVIKSAAEMVHHPLGERFQAMTSWDRANSPAQPKPVSAEKRS
jgi:CO/xanthine dehydrogenase Mo-binding subunit